MTVWIADEIEQKDKDSLGWMNDGTKAGIQPECTLTATLVFKILTYFYDSSLKITDCPFIAPPSIAPAFPGTSKLPVCLTIP